MTNIIAHTPTTSIEIQGDLNHNTLSLTPDHAITKFILHNNLTTTITTFTRQDPVSYTKTAIDWSMTTQINTPVTSGTLSPPLSDHLPTYTAYQCSPPRTTQQQHKTLSRRRYQKHRVEILSAMKRLISSTVDATQNETRQIQNIQAAITTVIEQYEQIPRPPRKPWCTPTMKKKIRKQHQLHQISTDNPTPDSIIAHRKYRNKLNKDIKRAKREHIILGLEENKNNPNAQTKILNSILPSKSRTRTSPTRIIYEGKEYTDPHDIAEHMNLHYITIGHKTSQSILQRPPPPTWPTQTNTPHLPQFTLEHTTEDIVSKTMKRINPHKAQDIHKITPAIIRDLTAFLAPTLTTIFNHAIRKGEYPDPLKLTKVIELYKKDDKTNPKNYRPISLLPIIAKLFDIIINTQLMEHLTKHDIISPTQYAFRPNSSTTTALQTILNRIHTDTKRKHPTLAIYVDLSKAYDTISHTKLIDKLKEEFNFSTRSVAFFRSYLNNRTQSLHTQQAASSFQTITHGIPQGSTLSTTFFLLYINNIIRTVRHSNVYTYADDTTLVISATSLDALESKAQKELDNLIYYFHSNNLVPNPTKTTYTIFYPKHPDHTTITVGDTTLKHTNNAKLLGYIVQSTLKHHATINNLVKKIRPTMYTFRHITQFIPTWKMKQLYYERIYPHLINTITIWGTEDRSNSYVAPLHLIHKKIIRIICHTSPTAHTAPLYERLQILNIYNLYTLRVCAELHPHIHPSPSPQNRPQHTHHYTPVTEQHEHKTRYSQQNKQYISKRTETYEARYASIWNRLPTTLSLEPNRKKFKVLLKHHLQAQQDNV